MVKMFPGNPAAVFSVYCVKKRLFACLLASGVFFSSGLFCHGAFAKDDNTYKQNIVKVNVLRATKGGKVSLGHGTGFVINQEGYIVTNWHVVNGAIAIFVLKDGQRVNAVQGFGIKDKFESANVEKNPWTSRDLDLAILKVKPEYWRHFQLQPVTITDRTPVQTATLTVQGYPGIADATVVESEDITAYSTFASGNVARVIDKGKWSPGAGQTIAQLLHTVPTSGGNSGGPLFDECGRVVGVHSASPTEQSTIVDNKGNRRVTGYVSNSSYGIASDIKELISVLDGQGIQYFLDKSECVSKDALYEETLKFALYWGGGALVLISLLLIYVIRNASAKQKIIHVVEGYSRALRSSRKPPQSPSPEATRKAMPESQESQGSLILDGYGSGASRYRLVIESAQLYAGEVAVGRDPGAPYVINDDSVSRKHCCFYAQGNDLLVRDLGSTNGTYVNGRKLSSGESATLNNGADLKLGSVSFRVIAG